MENENDVLSSDQYVVRDMILVDLLAKLVLLMILFRILLALSVLDDELMDETM